MADSWLKGKKVEEVTYSGGTFDSDGRKLTPSGGGGSVATDSIFTAKGDLPVGTGASTAQALAVGANDYVLTADSTQATGTKWAAVAPVSAKYIVQTADATLTAEQALSSLSTGLVKVTTGTGVLSTATAGTDYYNPGGTDVAVADGGTGASTAAGAATNLASAFPGYEIGYDQITSPVGVTSTTESSGTTVISCAAHTFDGSPVYAHFFCPYLQAFGNSNSTLTVSLFESSTQIGRLLVHINSNGAVQTTFEANGWLRFTPSSGSHTYTVTAFYAAASTTGIGAGAGGTGAYVPAFIRFIKA